MQDHPGKTDLSLWKQGLGAVPDWVWERTELETLVLADNGLSDLSERIGGLKKLRMLDLGHNRLTRLPAALGNLEAH
jgi:Leucine-rich repeat (LRR) protein